ncbi:uncharacterized protein I206_102912 [Kwoniella pini CBS 10737]|uniref:FCP1 homology domain-containing protein n=1 Tax=Kwoniella pini CBS 10737 TaxID=1296096 RepID=A0A1B9I6N6_9TREE|nr:uncharacterized protein I206_03263 [Kwoniella pini CBS 10737]OCF51197.1 hypothetical protein I206_03263 [Kwoniella pini CBS 10737]
MSSLNRNNSYRYNSVPNLGESSTHKRWPEDRNNPNSGMHSSKYTGRDYNNYRPNSPGDRFGGSYNERWDRSRNGIDDGRRDQERFTGNGHGNYERRNDNSRPLESRDNVKSRYEKSNQSQAAKPPYEMRGSYIPSYQRDTYHPATPPPYLPPFPPSLPTSPLYLPPRPLSPPSGPSGQSRVFSTSQSKFRTTFSRDRTVTPPPVSLPPQEYLELLKPTESLISDTVIPKLLVLDLNGALVFRNRNSDGKKSYPRPYLASFLEYLFLPHPKGEKRGWEVFVWSSAQPHNVRGMVEGAFGPRFIDGVWEDETPQGTAARKNGEGRLLGVWARDRMLDMKSADYTRKVQTTKDLRKLLEHLNNPSEEGKLPHSMRYEEKTVMLLDDSPLKAIYQPFNQLVIPEYGKEEYHSSKQAASTAGDGGMDQTLLAVIGVLHDLQNVTNVPAWINLGGLTGTLENNGKSENLPLGIEDLPTHDSFEHWFKDTNIFQTWVEKGRLALEERGIEVKHGITPDIPSSSHSSKPSSPYRRGQSPVRLYSKRGYHTNNRIDDDEISSPPPEQLRAANVINYLDDLISGTAKLTVNQKDSLEAAKEVLAELDGQGIDKENISDLDRQSQVNSNDFANNSTASSNHNGKADHHKMGNSRDKHDDTPRGNQRKTRIREKSINKVQRMAQKKDKSNQAFEEAKKENPNLSRKAFKIQSAQHRKKVSKPLKIVKSGLKGSHSGSKTGKQKSSKEASRNSMDKGAANPEEIDISNMSEGDCSFGRKGEDDVEEVTRDVFVRNMTIRLEKDIGHAKPGPIGKTISSCENPKAERNSTSKRSRPNSWEGEQWLL